MLGSYEELANASKDNMDVLVAAGDIWYKGYEAISKTLLAYAQGSAEHAAETAKAVMGAKTVQDAIDAQTDFAKQRFDILASEGTKISDLSMKTVNDAVAPIQKRFDDNISKFMKVAAG